VEIFWDFLQVGLVGHFTWGNLAMLVVGCLFIYLAITKDYEPLLLVPIGFGILVGNIPFARGMQLGVYETGSVLSYLYAGVRQGWYPPLIFLGIGAMTDFSSMLSSPRLILLGAAAQAGIFLTFAGSLALGFEEKEAAAIGIIGGADGPTAIFLSGHAGAAPARCDCRRGLFATWRSCR
jgi:Na+-transporting methylmalonyl-CoA/oxaloacetate decarboxylase beta subunit